MPSAFRGLQEADGVAGEGTKRVQAIGGGPGMKINTALTSTLRLFRDSMKFSLLGASGRASHRLLALNIELLQVGCRVLSKANPVF